MTAISRLSTTQTLAAGDVIPLSSVSAGCDVGVTVSVLAAYLQTLIGQGSGLVTQFWAPSATGFSVQVLAAGDGLGQSIWLLMTPTADFAAGTIVLPAATLCQDGQELLVTSTHVVTALTVNGNGATLNGVPTTIAANGAFRIKFSQVLQSWFPIT